MGGRCPKCIRNWFHMNMLEVGVVSESGDSHQVLLVSLHVCMHMSVVVAIELYSVAIELYSVAIELYSVAIELYSVAFICNHVKKTSNSP